MSAASKWSRTAARSGSVNGGVVVGLSLDDDSQRRLTMFLNWMAAT
jgi:hypothetical protein